MSQWTGAVQIYRPANFLTDDRRNCDFVRASKNSKKLTEYQRWFRSNDSVLEGGIPLTPNYMNCAVRVYRQNLAFIIPGNVISTLDSDDGD